MTRALYLFLLISSIFSQTTHKGDDLVKEGVHAFYNYEYDRALELLSMARQEHPDHPGVHFIWAAAAWTKSLAYDPVDTTHRVLEKVLADVTPIYDVLVKKYPLDPYYRLYQGSTIGLTARVTLAQKRWLATLIRAYQGFVIITDVAEENPGLMDGRLPLGIVEYYSGLGNTPLQWAVTLYGLNASTESGLNQMTLAADNSDWAWVEANGILSFLYLWVEDDPVLAGKHSRKVVETFPNNYYYHIMLLEATIKIGQLDVAWQIIDHLTATAENLTPRQREWYLPYLEYEKALFMFKKQKYGLALSYVQDTINNYSGELDVILGFAYLLQGKIKDLTGDRAGAKTSYRACLDLDNFSSAMSSANQYLNRPFSIP
jgi:hypothetical protein